MNERDFQPQHPEQREGVQLTLHEPNPGIGKNFKIGFTSTTELESQAYNVAIQHVLTAAKLNPMHQVGGANPNKIGYHAWEIWQRTNREQLEKLFEAIQTKAKEYIARNTQR